MRSAAVGIVCATLVAGLAGCAGRPAPQAGAPLPSPASVVHGSVEELLALLQQRGTPCQDVRGVRPLPSVAEEAVDCALAPGGEQVRLVHFRGPGSAMRFEQELRASGGHGVYAELWGASTDSEDAAARLAQAIASRGRS